MPNTISTRNRPSEVADAAELLTIDQICRALEIARSTFYDWKARRKGPRCMKLPNGSIRVRRIDFSAWLETLDVL